jgi:NIMA (never in mitosis gene a)-related kinase
VFFIGDGAYSSVYKVRRAEDQAVYALKKVKMLNLSDKEKENALNEVRILASINHNNVIAYKEAFIDEPSSSLWYVHIQIIQHMPFNHNFFFICSLVMEYADNGDVFQKICSY